MIFVIVINHRGNDKDYDEKKNNFPQGDSGD